MAKITEAMKKGLLCMIDCYRFLLGPFFGRACRFYPTCSAYAKEAIQHHGAIRGVILTTKRLLRCQPWCKGGVDFVEKSKLDE